MVRAFQRDFEVNGPSVVRIVRTTLAGWKRYKNHPDPRVRGRFAWEVRELATTFSAVVAAAKLYYRDKPAMHAKMSALLRDMQREFGWKSRFFAALGGPWVLRKLRKEERRLAAGWTYEPPTFYERNEAVTDRPQVNLCHAATPLAAPPSAHLPIVSPAAGAPVSPGVTRGGMRLSRRGCAVGSGRCSWPALQRGQGCPTSIRCRPGKGCVCRRRLPAG